MKHYLLILFVCTIVESNPTIPLWDPVWDLRSSTIFMPCNDSGLFSPNVATQFGIADFDWSNGKQLWANAHPMNTEQTFNEQLRQMHQPHWKNSTKTWVYRNLVKALPWFEQVREKLDDPQYSGWFLKFKPGGSYHVPQCTGTAPNKKCSDLYHDQEQTPEHPHGDGSCYDQCDCGKNPCGEYLWDHRNGTMLRNWLIHEFVGSKQWGLGNPWVSGFYLDDGWVRAGGSSSRRSGGGASGKVSCSQAPTGGPTEINYYCTQDMGLTTQEVDMIQAEWETTMTQAFKYVVSNGGFVWQLFYTYDEPLHTRQQQCSTFLRTACQPDSEVYTRALFYQFTYGTHSTFPLPAVSQDVAMFLLVRGPYAWLGYNWMGCGDQYEFPDLLRRDFGEPTTAICKETKWGSGVFVRNWSKAGVRMDCNTWEANITMSG